MSTIVIIVLVILVLAAVGILFFVYMGGGQTAFAQTNTTVGYGLSNLTKAASSP